MKLYLNENIRKYRKLRGMTQEQLAEAMGVSVGAVSKWESSQMNPEIGMIVKIADFFQLSVDSLLGYSYRSQNLSDTVSNIKALCAKKDYLSAKEEISKALLKYPNDFSIVYQSGITLSNLGWEREDKQAIAYSLQLLEHACSLIEQNTNPDISIGSIKSRIAIILSSLERNEEAIDIFKEYNINGVNNSRIGRCYADMKKYDQALTAFSESYIDNLVNIYICITGMSSCFAEMNRHDEALEMIIWLKNTLNALEYRDKPSYLIKMGIMLDIIQVMLHYAMNDKALAVPLMRKVLEKAKLFDANPDFSSNSIKFYSGEEHVFCDDIGQSAVEAVEKLLNMNDSEKDREELMVIWKEVLNEGQE
ncbi:MAG TPA: helix-turn-helix transcriptional regulator [Clostridia bacterium]|nr:helix-turn-helix transcriptional regulator [Clostridia bacterium]